MLTVHEMAERLGVGHVAIKTWRKHGLLLGIPYNDRNECLYPDPGPDPPAKMQGIKLSERRIYHQVRSHRAQGCSVKRDRSDPGSAAAGG